jgi:protein transport protein SEC23
MGDDMGFHAQEERDGLRFTWATWPSSKLEASRFGRLQRSCQCSSPPSNPTSRARPLPTRISPCRSVVPIACVYTPLKQVEGMPPAMEYDPVRCKQAKCGAVLNPYCHVDYASKHWTCPFCLSRNMFPQHYADNITETNLPAELIPQFTTLEYQLPGRAAAGPPAFLYLVDTCVPADELDHLKDSIQQSLSLLPPTALVGLVTYGTMVNVHDFSAPDCPRAFVFKGTKDYDSAQVQALLGLGGAASGPGGSGGASSAAAAGHNRFLVPVSEGSSSLERVLDDLQVCAWGSESSRPPPPASSRM